MSRSFVSLALFLAACGGAAPARSTVVTPENRSIRTTDWSARDASAPLWPASAARVELIVTPGWTANEHLLWVIEGGRKIDKVYRVEPDQASSFHTAITEITLAPQNTVLLWVTNGGQGIIKGPPPPPPPGPSGLPGDLINAVLGYAADVETANARFTRSAEAL